MIIQGYEGMELSTRLLIKEALQRNVEVEVLDWNDNFIRLKKGNKVEYVKQATKTSADTYISPLIMENKEVTKIILKENCINVPEGITVSRDKDMSRLPKDYAKEYTVFSDKDIVVKPKSTNFGKGVVILKRPYSAEDFKNALNYAFKYDESVMVEEFIAGREYRFLVIGSEVVAILHRVPANVAGDGYSSVKKLVEQKNMDPLRGKGYVTPLEKISLGEIEKEYLGYQGRDFSYIPSPGETVYLRENSNISTGGDSIDFTDDVLEAYKKIAVKAAKAAGVRICGADIIIQNIKEKPNKHNHSIIELNFNPALHIHDYPFKGENRHVEQKVLDLLGFSK